jgi:hypothetical protein
MAASSFKPGSHATRYDEMPVNSTRTGRVITLSQVEVSRASLPNRIRFHNRVRARC